MTGSRGRYGWRLAALGLALVQLPVLLRTGADPRQSDFANYFIPAVVLSEGGDVGALYDRDAFAAAMGKSGLAGLGSFVPHPPANALWLLPLASSAPGTAKAWWSGVLVAALGFTILAIAALSPRFTWPMAAVLVLAPTLAIRNGLAFGQPYLVLAGLLALGVLALERGRGLLAGFLLGLGVSFKPYALGIGFLFLRRERGRALAGFVGGAALPSLLLWALAGPGPFAEFSSKVMPWMLRGDIQDPFSPVWGSATALANRLLRFEPDLNPHPWMDAPLVARFLGSALPAALLALGILSGRRALESGRPLDAVGISVACALAASPFTASYHLVLLVVPVAAVVARRRGRAVIAVLLGWVILGSELMNLTRSASGILAPLGYVRLPALVILALAASWPFIAGRMARHALAFGALVGAAALPLHGNTEPWPRIEAARGYSMMQPYFCGSTLRWMSPSAAGRGLESRGGGEDCGLDAGASAGSGGASVVSRFTHGSWNLYLRKATTLAGETRLTFSSANEVDPVLTPDGCGVVFASDQGRGLGSTALYRLDLSGLRDGCGGAGPAGAPR